MILFGDSWLDILRFFKSRFLQITLKFLFFKVWRDGVIVGGPPWRLRPARVADHLRPERFHRRLAGLAAARDEPEEDAGHGPRKRTLQARTELQTKETNRQSLKDSCFMTSPPIKKSNIFGDAKKKYFVYIRQKFSLE